MKYGSQEPRTPRPAFWEERASRTGHVWHLFRSDAFALADRSRCGKVARYDVHLSPEADPDRVSARLKQGLICADCGGPKRLQGGDPVDAEADLDAASYDTEANQSRKETS